jgi:hypothetical protein
MASTGNGHANGHGDGPPRTAPRWDPDDLARRSALKDEASASGRRFVIAGLIATAVIWGGVYLAFLYWRATYRALAEFGAAEVAPLVDPLSDRVPPGVDPAAWTSAVADTHAMLVALTGAGLLDRTQMEALRSDVAARVARASAGSPREEMARLWDDMEARAGPAIAPDESSPPPGSRQAARHPRPKRPSLLKRATGG